MVNVDVEYCRECGHIKRYMEMKSVILERVPETKISGRSGRESSFEVEVNKQLVYSKLITQQFPDYNAIAGVVEDAANGKPVTPIRKHLQEDVCVIL